MNKAPELQYRATPAEIDPDTGRYAESRAASRMTAEQRRLFETKQRLAAIAFERELRAIERENWG